jgi:hypothetical protein
MLWIDSVSHQDEDAFRAPLLPPVDYAGLVTPGLAYSDLRTSLEQSIPVMQRQSSLSGWVPNSVPIAVAAGAGQARAIGRVISAAQLVEVKAALQGANDRMSGVTVSSELAELSAKFGQSTDVAQPTPIAIVISSIAGGSGSGMFLDVVEALKSVNPDFREPINLMTVLYTPDVFASIGGAGTQIPPNALAAIVETTAGVLADGLSEQTAALFQSNGLVGRSRHGFGAKCNFLVGSGNQNVNLGSQENIYYAVGESLCAVVTDDNVQQQLRAFALTNTFLQSGQAMVVQDESRLTDAADDDQSMPFAALGMGRVSLGLDRFADYIAGLMGRDITEQLLWPEFEPVDPQRQMTKEQMIDERISGVWEDFLSRSGLNERNPADDVINALVDGGQKQRLASWATECLNRARQGVDDSGLQKTEWSQRLHQQFDNYLPAIRAQETAARYECAQAWTTQIQSQLVELVGVSAIRFGLPVTIRILEKLLEEMTFVTDELTVECQTKMGQVSLVSGKITQVLSSGGSKLPSDDAAIGQAVQVLRIGAELIIDADRHELASTLIADLSENQVRPLLRACQFSRAQLSASVNAEKLDDGRPNDWALLPAFGKPVPSQLLPGATERVLVQPVDYPTVLTEQVGLCLQNSNEKSAWRTVFRERASLGRKLSTGEGDVAALIRTTASWIPRDTKASETSMAAATASFSMPKSFSEVVESVSAWLVNTEASAGLGAFLGQSLSRYVTSGTPDQQVQRQSDLISAFTQAVDVAAPFVKVNSAVRAVLHPNVDASTKTVVSTIPFQVGDAMYPKIKNVLVNGGLWKDSHSPGWFATADVKGIEVFTMSDKAMMPMVFDNLMRPIAETWAKNNGNQNLKHSFWSNRRARPLDECIPAGPGQIEAMLRGWFLAGLFNLREVSSDAQLGWKVNIWNEESRSELTFPFPLLSSSPVNKMELPAVILKSLSIALVRVNELGSLEPLKPYWELLDLGHGYVSILENWVREGIGPSSHRKPDLKLTGSASDSLEERRQLVLATLDKTLASFNADFGSFEERAEYAGASRSWEIRGRIREALLMLTTAAVGVTDDTGVL